MMSFFERIKRHASGMTDTQINARLNEVETELFNAVPWALDLPEHQQNDLVEYVFSRVA